MIQRKSFFFYRLKASAVIFLLFAAPVYAFAPTLEGVDESFVLKMMERLASMDWVDASRKDGVVYALPSTRYSYVKIGVSNERNLESRNQQTLHNNPYANLSKQGRVKHRCGERLRCWILEQTVQHHLQLEGNWLAPSLETEFSSREIYDISPHNARILIIAYDRALKPFDRFISKAAKVMEKSKVRAPALAAQLAKKSAARSAVLARLVKFGKISSRRAGWVGGMLLIYDLYDYSFPAEQDDSELKQIARSRKLIQEAEDEIAAQKLYTWLDEIGSELSADLWECTWVDDERVDVLGKEIGRSRFEILRKFPTSEFGSISCSEPLDQQWDAAWNARSIVWFSDLDSDHPDLFEALTTDQTYQVPAEPRVSAEIVPSVSDEDFRRYCGWVFRFGAERVVNSLAWRYRFFALKLHGWRLGMGALQDMREVKELFTNYYGEAKRLNARMEWLDNFSSRMVRACRQEGEARGLL
ncbi:hypothetical protein LX81_03487 [Palleronia aestuarii]|uniref:GIY-YIG domain-containing protein n=1 Tax=Palleronia aestuarii TaxID=568105 RepID=A0A2W7MY78_9RHOB|nr:hypothetical protein [Palleronia aestuarii]PZX12780.1 hypothetical protein LX81_03487 [Palleronia aestuarii]